MFKVFSSAEGNSTKVVGTSFCQENLIELCGPKGPESVDLEMPTEFVLENNHPMDSNAVAVMINNLKVGYLSKREAMVHRIFIHNCDYSKDRLICIGKISGGWDNGNGDCGHYGVTVGLPYKAGLDVLITYLNSTIWFDDYKGEIQQHKIEYSLSSPCN